MVLAFNDIQSDYYQVPLEDKEKIKVAEEKIRENLKNKNLETNQDNDRQLEPSEPKEINNEDNKRRK